MKLNVALVASLVLIAWLPDALGIVWCVVVGSAVGWRLGSGCGRH